MERIANGMWYQKPKLAEITTEKKAKSVKRKVKASKTTKEAEMENTLFHYGCICKVCKEFDKFKESKRKGAVASPALAQVTPDKGNLLDGAKPQAKKKVSAKGKPEKTKETKPSNIYSVLKLDDPGNSCQVSGLRKCASSMKGKGLKGGAQTKSIEMQPIFEMAVKEAEKHGIKVTPDIPNPALGDCLFESILDNVNHRQDDFPEKFEDGVDSYRELFVTELEERYKDKPVFPGYNGNEMTDEQLGEWTAAWTQQKNPREFNVDKFNVSDLTPLGLGHCMKRHILVFSNVPNEEVRVFDARLFEADIELTTEVPVVIAYDCRGSGHYESLLPKTKTDVKKCTVLSIPFTLSTCVSPKCGSRTRVPFKRVRNSCTFLTEGYPLRHATFSDTFLIHISYGYHLHLHVFTLYVS